jgi:hypothetical protein
VGQLVGQSQSQGRRVPSRRYGLPWVLASITVPRRRPAVGEGNYGRLGAEQQRRFTDANVETMFGEPAADGTPDEQPGAMPEIVPSPDFGKNIDNCWICQLDVPPRIGQALPDHRQRRGGTHKTAMDRTHHSNRLARALRDS